MTATSKMSRASWGLDTGPDSADWWHQAICAEQPDLWARRAHMNVAAHLCAHHCPVLKQCRAETERIAPMAGVQAGIVWTTAGEGGSGNTGTRAAVQAMGLPHGRHCTRWPKTPSTVGAA